MNRPALNLLGLCMRAGRLVSGEQAVLNAIRSGKARLVVVDAGASQNTQKMFADSCEYYDVARIMAPEGALGAAIGRPGRMAAAVTDEGFARRIQELSGQEARTATPPEG